MANDSATDKSRDIQRQVREIKDHLLQSTIAVERARYVKSLAKRNKLNMPPPFRLFGFHLSLALFYLETFFTRQTGNE